MASYSGMSARANNIAKAGWLYRRSTILRRWKRNWFVLDKQGDLRYYESPDSPKAEERFVVRAQVLSVQSGREVCRYDPPDGISSASCGFLVISIRDNDKMVLCSESSDEMKAWQIVIDEARALPSANPMYPPGSAVVGGSGYVPYGSPMGYGNAMFPSGYGGQVISTNPTVVPGAQQVIQTPTGTTIIQAPPQQIVVVDDDPWRFGRHRRGYGYGPYGHMGHFTWY